MAQLMYYDTGSSQWLPVVVGAQGLVGIQGTTGAGAQGVTGSQGVTGTQGLVGIQGTTGAGAQGTIGSQGVQGLVGSGTQGAQGTTGAGVQGTQGLTGAGVQGAQGTVGTQGPNAAISFGPTPPSSPLIGDRWVDSNSGSEYTWVYDGNTYQWVEVSASGFAGEQGTQGTQGIQGPQGLQGIQGYGYQQLQGAQGTQGIQGTISAQGAQGTQGFQGVQGTTGAGLQGAQGTVGSAGSTVSPTFTGTVTMPTGTTGVAPELYVSGGPLNTPVAGAVEYDGNVWYQTPNTTAGRAPVDVSYFNTISTSQPAPLRNTTGAQAMFGAWQAASGTLGTPTGTGPWTVVITAIPTGQTGFRPGTNITATAGVGTFNTNTVTVVSVDSATQITVSATGGTIPTAGGVTLITSTTTGALTVPANTTYLIEVVANILATGQTGTNLLQFGFGGAATISNLQYESTYGPQTTIGTAGTPRVLMQTLTAGTLTSMYSTAATNLANPFTIKGLIRIGSSGGTLIPQIAWSAAATTGVCSIVPGSYIRLTPIGSNTVIYSGVWA